MKPRSSCGQLPAIRDLYPQLSDAELQQAEENLDRYIALVWRIYERVQQDPEAYAAFKTLTASRADPTMHREPPLAA